MGGTYLVSVCLFKSLFTRQNMPNIIDAVRNLNVSVLGLNNGYSLAPKSVVQSDVRAS